MLKNPVKRHYFTLVELLVAMGLLSVMMLLMVELSNQSQQLWRSTEHSARAYENSRTAFDQLERDIKSMIASSAPNRQVKFEVLTSRPDGPSLDPSDCLLFAVVSSQAPYANSVTRYNEIIYRHHVSPSEPDTQYSLQRQMVSDNDATNWNCLNPDPDWHENEIFAGEGKFETMISGVSEFEIKFYDINNNRIPAGTYATLPNRVVVNMVVFDEALSDEVATLRSQTERTFSKVFFLANLDEQ